MSDQSVPPMEPSAVIAAAVERKLESSIALPKEEPPKEVKEVVQEAVSAAVEPSPTVEVQSQKRIARDRKHTFTPDDGEPTVGLSGQLKLRYVVLRTVTYKHTIVEPIVIRKGFRTDLASIPKPLWLLPGLDPVDPRWRCALVHDWLYAEQTTDRTVVDILFRDGVIQDGVSPLVAWFAWFLIRMIGWWRWRQVEKEFEKQFAAANNQTYEQPSRLRGFAITAMTLVLVASMFYMAWTHLVK